jgi:hypothetical protein
VSPAKFYRAGGRCASDARKYNSSVNPSARHEEKKKKKRKKVLSAAVLSTECNSEIRNFNYRRSVQTLCIEVLQFRIALRHFSTQHSALSSPRTQQFFLVL